MRYLAIIVLLLLAACEQMDDLEVRYVNGHSMEPLLANGDAVILDMNYTKDYKAGDIVAYAYAGTKNPAVKIIKATASDQLILNGSILYINGEPMINSAGNQYIFNTKQQRMLGLYIINGHIPDGSFFIFGDNTASSDDSRVFGAISTSDILARIYIPTKDLN